jgi:hypothetical protein
MSEVDFLEQSKKFKAAQAKLKGGTAVQEPELESQAAIDTTAESSTSAENTMALPKTTWPVLDDAALFGLAGDAVRMLGPHTEADRVALLASLLSEFGAMLNRSPHLVLDGTYHPLLLWFILVGKSSKSRKGTADKRIHGLCKLAEPAWERGEYKGTLSSGEGLAFAIRDPQFREEPVKEKGSPTGDTIKLCVDSGVEDKRLFLVQPEFGAVLRVMAREGNSLSGVLRDGWDGMDLAPMTKSNRVKATHPHVGIVGHVTTDELRRNLTDTEMSNGFGNRFIFLAVRRSQELPFGSTPDHKIFSSVAARIGKALQHGRATGQLTLTPAACEAWKAIYHDLSRDRPGLTGSLLGRAEAQVMRLSALYALLDQKAEIDSPHLGAAVALWEYAEQSTAMIFGDSTGDFVADTILQAVRAAGALSDSEISAKFSRNVDATRLQQAKATLLEYGLLSHTEVETDGRTKQVWSPVTKQTKETKKAT